MYLDEAVPHEASYFASSVSVDNDGSSLHANVSADLSSGDHLFGTWVLVISIPPNSTEPLHYVAHVSDTAFQLTSSEEKDVIIKDNDPPIFYDNPTQSNATTGDGFALSINVTDNINLSQVTVEYWYGDAGTHMTESMSFVSGILWNHSITVPTDSLEPLHYHFYAMDNSSNFNISETWDVTVTDNDPPEVVEDLSDITATTGDVFHARIRVRDNIGIDLVNSGKSMWTPTDVDELGNGIYEQELRMDDGDVGPFYLSVRVLDLAGNELTYLVVTA